MRLKFWNIKPMLFPLKSAASSLFNVLMSVAFIITCPWVGLSRQPIRFNIVVLPLPEGPTKEMNLLFSISRLTFF